MNVESKRSLQFMFIFMFYWTQVVECQTYYNGRKCVLADDGGRKFHTSSGYLSCNEGVCPPYKDNTAHQYCHVCCYGTNLKNVNGSWSEWSSWSECSGSCNEGTRARARSCTAPSQSGNGLICRLNNGSFGAVEMELDKCQLNKCSEKEFDRCLIGLTSSYAIFILILASLCFMWKKGKYCFKVRDKAKPDHLSAQDNVTLVVMGSGTCDQESGSDE